MTARTALVVGAGIGGLSTALALQQAGWKPHVFEQAASPRELGFGLLVAPNAVAALRQLGVADVVLARAFAPVRGEGRRPDGTVIKRAEFPPAAALGGPTVVALRPALHGALLEAVHQDCLNLSSRVVDIEIDERRPAVTLNDGRHVAGDVLIGADGIGSVVRRRLHPDEGPPRSSRIVAVRGAVHGAVHHLRDLSAVYYLGRGIEAFLVRASSTGIYWALSLAEQLIPDGSRDPAAILQRMSPHMDSTFRAVTANSDEMRCDELVDRDPLAVWGRGGVTLLGDAAHPVLPHTGQGAAQAMMDAVTLGQTLTREADVQQALRTYEAARQAKTAALVAQGRRTAAVMRMTSPVGCLVRELAVRAAPITPLVRVFARLNRRAGTRVDA